MNKIKHAIFFLGVVGSLFFTALFMISFYSPRLVEAALKKVVLIEVERRAKAQVHTVLNPRLVQLGQLALDKTDAQIAQSNQALEEAISREAASVVADMTRPDCECRIRLATAVRTFETSRVGSLHQLRSHLSSLVESAYANVSSNLMREFRIFTGTNGIAFILLTCALIARRRASAQLLLPAIAVFCAVVITAGLYLFGQNWLHSIIFNDYMGLAYAAYFLVVVFLLIDIMSNRARVTTRMINAGLHVIGSAVVVAHC